MNDRNKIMQDIKDDFEEIEYLCLNYLKVFKKHVIQIKENKSHIQPDVADKTITDCYGKIKEIEGEVKKLESVRNDYASFTGRKKKVRALLRYWAVFAGGLTISADWQSPGFVHSLISEAGRQTGKIKGTINDYKRDVHLDEKEFEEMFLKEYVTAKNKYFLKSYLTNSGQAAFQTILTYFLSENKLKGKVLVGKSSYFQYKQILAGTYGRNLIEAEETDTKGVLDRVEDDSISAIFLDSLCNSATISVPDLETIISYLNKNIKHNLYLIIDNTCLSVFCQPFNLKKNRKIHLLTFESLNKYYQFGLDRVTAGIIVCENKDAGGIFEYRKHAGTNITDSSVYALPRPKRKILAKRIERHQRNAMKLAEYLSQVIPGRAGESKIKKIIYPGQGSFLNIRFKQKYNTPGVMIKFLNTVISTAKKQNVNIIGGTSFGLNTTRIYLTAIWSKYSAPFLRISAGTEDILEVNKICEVFAEAIRRY